MNAKYNRKFYRLNYQITAPELRLLDEEGKQIGVVTKIEALQKAKEHGLDVVEIAPNATPPVAKLIDYKKMTGNNPGGIESGADFKLFVSGKKGSYYQTDMDQKVALTSEEKEMVRTEGLYELDRIFKPTPNENLEDKLYGAAPVKPTNNPNIQKKVATNFSNQNEFEMDDEKKPAKVASSKQDDDMDF